jgi:hypothetical protein
MIGTDRDTDRELILIFGAGAIGRGFMPWVFPEHRYRFGFVDTNERLIEDLRRRGSYTTYMADPAGGFRQRSIPVSGAWRLSDFHLANVETPVTCYVAVGPRRVVEAVAPLAGYRRPIVLLENDDKSVDVAKATLNQDNVYFAIPDVIASNTASPEHLADDPLALHTENGTLHIDAGPRSSRERSTTATPTSCENSGWRSCIFTIPRIASRPTSARFCVRHTSTT